MQSVKFCKEYLWISKNAYNRILIKKNTKWCI